MDDKKSYKKLSEKLESKRKAGSESNRAFTSGMPNQEKKVATMKTSGTRMPKMKLRLPKTNNTGSRDLFRSSSVSQILTLVRIILPFVLVFIALFFIVFLCVRKNGTEIAINSNVVAHVKAKMTYDDLTKVLTTKLAETEGTGVQLEDKITLRPVRVKNKYKMDNSELIAEMVKRVTYKLKASKITVDGESVAIAKNKAEAQAVLDSIINKYLTEGHTLTSKSFVEDVKTEDVFAYKDQISSNDTIRAILEKVSVEKSTVKVKAGDTLSKIAKDNGMTLTELKVQNPKLDVNKALKIDQEIAVVFSKPFISVQTIESKVESVPEKRPVEEQVDSSLGAGQIRIISQGKDGKSEVTTNIKRINGVIVSVDEATKKVVEPAQPQVVAKSSK